MKSLLFFIVKMSFSFVLLFFFLRNLNLTLLLQSLRNIDHISYFFLVIIYVVAHFINSCKWHIICRSVSVLRLFNITLIAQFYMMILPGQLGAEVIKGFYLSKHIDDYGEITSSIIYDRFLSLCSMLILGIFGLVVRFSYIPKSVKISYIALIIFFGLFLVFGYVFFQSIQQYVIQMSNNTTGWFKKIACVVRTAISSLSLFNSNIVNIIKMILLGILFHLICVFVLVWIADMVELKISIFDVMWIYSIVSLIILLPISIGGIGVREGSFISIMALIGIGNEQALSISLLNFGLILILMMIGASLSLIDRAKSNL